MSESAILIFRIHPRPEGGSKSSDSTALQKPAGWPKRKCDNSNSFQLRLDFPESIRSDLSARDERGLHTQRRFSEMEIKLTKERITRVLDCLYASLYAVTHVRVLRTQNPFASRPSPPPLFSLFLRLRFPPLPPGSSNRDTQFSRLHARVAETAVERNFRSRKKPRANIAIKFASCKNSSCNPPPASLSLSLSFRDPGRNPVPRFLLRRSGSLRSTAKRICTLDRPRLRDRGGGEKENRCDPFAMGKRDRGRSRGGGHDMR